MKRILSIALAFLFVAGVCLAAGPTGPNNPGDILGQVKYQYEPHRVFRLVHVSPNDNDSNGIAAGSVVVWDDLLDDGVSVQTTTTSGDAKIAGVLVTTVVSDDTDAALHEATRDAGSNANWGWLQTYGLYQDATVNAAAAVIAGDAICAGSTAGAISGFAISTVYAASTNNKNVGILGCALDSAAASGTADIFIRVD